MGDTDTNSNHANGGAAGPTIDTKQLVRLLHDVADAQIKIVKLIDGFWDNLQALAERCQRASDEVQQAARRLEKVLQAAPDPSQTNGGGDVSRGDGAATDRSERAQNPSPNQDQGQDDKGSLNKKSRRPPAVIRRPVRLGVRPAPPVATPAPSTTTPAPASKLVATTEPSGGSSASPSSRPSPPSSGPTSLGPAENEDDIAELVDELKYLVVEAQRIFDLLSRR